MVLLLFSLLGRNGRREMSWQPRSQMRKKGLYITWAKWRESNRTFPLSSPAAKSRQGGTVNVAIPIAWAYIESKARGSTLYLYHFPCMNPRFAPKLMHVWSTLFPLSLLPKILSLCPPKFVASFPVIAWSSYESSPNYASHSQMPPKQAPGSPPKGKFRDSEIFFWLSMGNCKIFATEKII